MNKYLMLTLLKEDHTIKLRFESTTAEKGIYFNYTIDILNGTIIKERKEGDDTGIYPDIKEKIELYQKISKKIYPMVTTKTMQIEELQYDEKRTVGLLPNWRFTKNQTVEYRTICEITYQEKTVNETFIFHIDPKDELYRIFILMEQKKVDITNILAVELKEKIKHYFLNESKYRLKIMYLKNQYH